MLFIWTHFFRFAESDNEELSKPLRWVEIDNFTDFEVFNFEILTNRMLGATRFCVSTPCELLNVQVKLAS